MISSKDQSPGDTKSGKSALCTVASQNVLIFTISLRGNSCQFLFCCVTDPDPQGSGIFA